MPVLAAFRAHRPACAGALCATFLVCSVTASVAPAAAPAKRLVYTTTARGENDLIWTANVDGSGAHKIAKGLAPDVSPDGRNVAFTVIRRVRIGAHRRRANRKRLTQSVDVIAATGGRPREVVTMPVESVDLGLSAPVTSTRRATAAGRNQTGFGDLLAGALLSVPVAWSPDSTELAVPGSDRLQSGMTVVDVASGRKTTAATGRVGGIAFAPSASSLVYTAGREDLRTLDLASGAIRTIARPAYGGAVPVWGSDAIAFGTPSGRNVGVVKPDGSRLRFMPLPGRPELQTLGWRASDGFLLVSAAHSGSDRSDVASIDPSDGSTLLLRTLDAKARIEAGGFSEALMEPLRLSGDCSSLLAIEFDLSLRLSRRGRPSLRVGTHISRVSLTEAKAAPVRLATATNADWNL